MPALAGRALRIKYDSGAGAVAIVGSTSDNFTITKEGINITDKDDAGVQTFLDDAVGTWAMEGSIEGILKDDTLMALLESTTQVTSFNPTGAEGAEAVTFTANLASSGEITYTPAT